MTTPWAVVIGIGNELRRGDAIGPAAAAEIQRRKIPGVRVVISHGEPMGLLDAWTGVRLAVLIDAVICEPCTPGRWRRIAADPLSSPVGVVGTHGIGVPEALELGRVLHRMPQQLIIYAVEALDVRVGLGLSAPLAATVPILADAVLGELNRTDTG
jgi:hydrogenase maturation protease